MSKHVLHLITIDLYKVKAWLFPLKFQNITHLGTDAVSCLPRKQHVIFATFPCSLELHFAFYVMLWYGMNLSDSCESCAI
jgi:hypothetical protein